MQTINVSYSDILAIRRNYILTTDKKVVLFYDRSITGYYDLFLNLDGILITCNISNDSDLLDFETYRKKYSNIIDYPVSRDIKTHDFSDSSTWVNGSDNSLYSIYPESNKSIKLKRIIVLLDKDSTFTESGSVKIVFWNSILSSCPSYTNGVVTPYGGSGWIQTYPPAGDYQIQKTFVYLSGGLKQYIVNEFTYRNTQEIMSKSEFNIYGNNLFCKFDYQKYYGSYVYLRSSMNERVEIFSSDDSAVNSPNNIPTEISMFFDVFNEW